jgi:HEAT repeat protein
VGSLVRLLNDDDDKVRAFVAVHLIRLDCGVVKSAFEEQGGELQAISRMLHFGDLISMSLALLVFAEDKSLEARQYCTSQSATIRLACVVALTRFGVSVVSDLLVLLSDQVAAIRQAAAYALGEIASEEAVSGLERAVLDECADVRFYALVALGKIADLPQAPMRIIVARLQDSEPSVRKAVWIALSMIDERAELVLPELLAALPSNYLDVRGTVLNALGRIKPRSADVVYQLLLALKSDDGSTVPWIKSTLADLVPLAVNWPEPEVMKELIRQLPDDPHMIAEVVTKALEAVS